MSPVAASSSEAGGEMQLMGIDRWVIRCSRDLSYMATRHQPAALPNQTRFNFDRPAVDLSEPLLTAGQAAAMLSVRTSWIYDAARSGALPCVHIGKHIRFLRSELERWVAEQRRGR